LQELESKLDKELLPEGAGKVREAILVEKETIAKGISPEDQKRAVAGKLLVLLFNQKAQIGPEERAVESFRPGATEAKLFFSKLVSKESDADSDADGKFKVMVEDNNWVAALGWRKVGGAYERYFWLVEAPHKKPQVFLSSNNSDAAAMAFILEKFVNQDSPKSDPEVTAKADKIFKEEKEKQEAQKVAMEKAAKEQAVAERESALKAVRENIEATQKRDKENGLEAGVVKTAKISKGATLQFRFCPAGSFAMGALPGKREPVAVVISRGFWMMETEVTQAQWKAVMGAENPSYFKGDNRPVEQVSWEDAQKFITKLNSAGSAPKEWRFDLPSEAQWEYACRAGTTTAYSSGDVLTREQARFGEKYEQGTSEVGKYPANAWGLLDMHGNVWEWCKGFYGKELQGGVDPKGPAEGVKRVLRGGSWGNVAAYCSSANRYGFGGPGDRNAGIGFRLALVPSP
jgi:formylglycine-generating enzyme required for sulfatase activity